MNDPHRILDLPYDATPEQVKERYRQLVRIFHPDRYRKDADRLYAEAKLKEINEAYEALLNRSQLALSQEDGLPEPVFWPEAVDFGSVPHGETSQRQVQIGNSGAQAKSLQIHLGDGQSWFSIVKGQRLNTSQPLPLNLELAANTALLTPDQRYESWIEVDMDGQRARLPLQLHVTPAKTRAPTPLSWLPIALVILLGGALYMGARYVRTLSDGTTAATTPAAAVAASDPAAASINEPTIVVVADASGAAAGSAQEPVVEPVAEPVVAVIAATATPSAPSQPTAVAIATGASDSAASDPQPPTAQPVATSQSDTATAPSAAPATAIPTATLTTAPSATPTSTPTVTPAATATTASIATPTVPPSPTPGPAALPQVTIRVPDDYQVNARSETSVDSASFGLLEKGSVHPAVARTIDSAWVQITLPDARVAWVYRESVEADLAAVETLPVVYTAVPTEAPVDAPVGAPVDAPTEGSNQSLTEPEDPTPEDAATVDAVPQEGAPPAADNQSTQTAAQTHVVQSGDFLKQLAIQYYGNEELWTLIYDANIGGIGPDPDLLPLGLELAIPPAP